jgi:hypothetical protein
MSILFLRRLVMISHSSIMMDEREPMLCDELASGRGWQQNGHCPPSHMSISSSLRRPPRRRYVAQPPRSEWLLPPRSGALNRGAHRVSRNRSNAHASSLSVSHHFSISAGVAVRRKYIEIGRVKKALGLVCRRAFGMNEHRGDRPRVLLSIPALKHHKV